MKHRVKVLIDDNGKPISNQYHDIYIIFPVWYKVMFDFDSGSYKYPYDDPPPEDEQPDVWGEANFNFKFVGGIDSGKAYLYSAIFPKTVNIEQDLNNCEMVVTSAGRYSRGFKFKKIKADKENFSASVTITFCVDHYKSTSFQHWREIENILNKENGYNDSDLNKVAPEIETSTDVSLYYPDYKLTASWSLL